MLSPTLDTVRLFVHVLAASIWVGGQVVLLGIVPTLRASHPEATRLVAVAYGKVAWPAFAVVIVTGLWNLSEISVSGTDTAYQITLFAKIVLAVVSGAAAAVHQAGRSRLALAVGGAVGFVAAVGALFVAFLLRTGA